MCVVCECECVCVCMCMYVYVCVCVCFRIFHPVIASLKPAFDISVHFAFDHRGKRWPIVAGQAFQDSLDLVSHEEDIPPVVLSELRDICDR
jgi:hypothetical protein